MVFTGPFYLSRGSLEIQHIRLAFPAAEIVYRTILFNEHNTGSRFNEITAKVAFFLCHLIHLTDNLFASLAVSLSMRMSPTLIGPVTFLVIILP